jgi:hypothetical protein
MDWVRIKDDVKKEKKNLISDKGIGSLENQVPGFS